VYLSTVKVPGHLVDCQAQPIGQGCLGVVGYVVDRQAEHVPVTPRGQAANVTRKLDLVGVTEIAELLNVSRQRVHQMIREYLDFPAPVAEITAGKIWERKDVEDWARRSGRI
jgi:hypothetical protein